MKRPVKPVTPPCHSPRLEQLEDRFVLAGDYLGTPFLGQPVDLSLVNAVKIEAERFDNGGPGIAYVDLDKRNGSTSFRPNESVDMWTGTTDGAEGHSVMNFQAGESMNYTIDVPSHGEYDITFRVSSPAAAGTIGAYFHLEALSEHHLDEPPVRSGLVIIPGSGSVVNWSTLTVRGMHLHEGTNILKLVSDFGNTAIDHFTIQPSADVHTGNASSADEHHQLEDLLPAGDATHVAIRTGNWSDPNTWSFGQLPTADAKVWVPEGISLTYNLNSSTPIQSIRVDGTFSFATNISTRLLVDTIGVTARGTYIHGTAANPVGPSFSSTVIFTDSGPIDRAADPTELGRGLISHGKASIYGAEKSTQHFLQTNPAAGTTVLSLSVAPTGWRVGDEIIIAGVRARDISPSPVPTADTPQSPKITTEDEVRIITAINGTSVTLDRPLTYDHIPPGNITDFEGKLLRVYVANTTRSIRYQSANTSYANNADIHRHGHVMFMHNDKVTVNFAEFRDLGRTNKAISIDDVLIEPISNQQVKFTPGTGTNVRGRYSLHFHKTGIDGQAAPIIARGNTVVGGPGWGYVNHQSNVEFYDNVAFNVPGASFVEEDGTGIGSFRRNISIASRGTGRLQPFMDDGDLRDMGFSGHGFFFRGNATIADDNIVASAAHSGYAWSNKGEVRVVVNELDIPSSSLLDPEIALGAKSLAWEAVPTKFFRRNVTIASGSAIAASFWMQPSSTQHDGRNEIRDFTGWNLIGEEAAFIQYTRALTWKNVRLHRDQSLPTRGSVGVRADVNTTGDHVFDNVKVTGYNTGLVTKPLSNTFQQRYFIISNSDFATGNGKALADPTNIINVDRASIPANSPLNFVGIAEPVREEGAINVGMFISGTKTDSLGTEVIGGRDTSTFRFYLGGEQTRELLAKGYFQDVQGTFIIVPILVTDRFTLTTRVVPVRAAFDPSSYTTIPIGPNLGFYAGINGRGFRQVNVGGPAAGGMQADNGFSGGTIISTNQYVNNGWSHGVAVPTIYQTARSGASTYSATGLAANAVYTVRLHFAEIQQSEIGKRQFNVRIQNKDVLENLDIVGAIGSSFRALVKEFTVTADAVGMIRIQFLKGAIGDPLINGIEILDQIDSLVAQAPSPAPIQDRMSNPRSSPSPAQRPAR